MGLLRPATPGFVVTLVATVLLAVVSFSVPWFQSVFFLKASLSFDNEVGFITFGTLGYCIELAGGTTCSKPSIGYEIDINGLVGNKLPVQIPEVLIKWLTYALALHIVALILSAGSAVFGLLAHIREMAMTCCSICISGFAAVVALLAFIFDISLFLVAKSRINKVPGGSATIGNAIWLTFAAMVLLFFSGCFYTLGRCCISNRRSTKNDWSRGEGPVHVPGPTGGGGGYADRMRLDAIKAEADRKARQQQAEVGLPAFPESTPLKARIDGDEVYLLGDEESQGSQHTMNSLGGGPGYGRRPSQNDLGGDPGYGRRPSQNDLGGGYAGGYVQGPPGGRAIDQYYNNDPASTYPPQPARKPSAPQSAYAQANYAQSNYPPSNYGQSTYPNAPATAPVANTNYLAPNQQYGADRYANSPDQYASGQDRYANLSADYGHTAGGTTYHTAHGQYESQYDTQGGVDSNARRDPSLYNPYIGQAGQPERSYSLGGGEYGGGEYGGNDYGHGSGPVPPLPERGQDPYYTYQQQAIASSTPPINTNLAYQPSNTSPVKGPRSPVPRPREDESPPGYDAGPSQPPGAWGVKR